MNAEKSLRYLSLLLLSAIGLAAKSFTPTEATAGITDNPGFGNGNYSVCNYPNQGDSVTSYGPDRNLSGITLTSTNWRCSAGGVGVNGEIVVAVKQPLLRESLIFSRPVLVEAGITKTLFLLRGIMTTMGPWIY